MRPAYGRVLPEIPSAVSVCLIKTPCCKKMIINIHKLRQDRPPYNLQHSVYRYNNCGIKIPGYIFAVHKDGLGRLLGEYVYKHIY